MGDSAQSQNQTLNFGKKLAELMSLATEVIRIEEGKINKTFSLGRH